MKIDARNLAAVLSYSGADVESALLELASVSPTLDSLVRKELFRDCNAKLRYIADRHGEGLRFVSHDVPKHVCAMHAVDQMTRFLDDADIVSYLQSQFPETEELCRRYSS